MVYHDDTKNTMWYTPSKVTLEYVFVLFAPSWFNLSSSGGRDVGSRRTSGVVQMSLHVIAEAMTIGLLSVCISACSQNLTVPSQVGSVDQLVNALRAQGRAVSVGGENSPQRNGYFSVSSRDVFVGEMLLKAFEYQTAGSADSDAALISPDGQPNPRA
jgi:hypothetical protein